MPKYKLTDDATGMSVVVNSDNGLTEQGVQSTLAEARKQAAKSIETGRYKLDPKTNEELSSEAANDKLRRYAGYSMGVKPEEMDVDSGASLWERTKMDLLPDDSSRMEYLEKKYGAENVSALNVGGTAKMFYRDPKSNKMTMVDEMGTSLADFTADIAGEAVTTAGAVGGAIAGTALAPGAGTGAGALAGATAGAALGGFLTGVTQDVAAETLAGQDVEIGEIAKRRAIEAGIGIPIDLVTAGAGRFISKRIGKNVVDDMVSGLDKAEKQLAKRGIEIDRTAGMETGRRAMADESVIAGKRSSSLISRKLQGIRDTLGDFQRAVQGEGDGAGAFGKTIQKIQSDANDLVEEIAKQDTKAAATIRKSLDRKIARMQVQEEGMDSLGAKMRNVFKLGKSEAQDRNATNWTNLEQQAAQRGVSVSGREAAESLKQGVSKMSDVKLRKNPEVRAEIERLEQMGDETISFKDLRATIETIQDMVPAGGATGGKVAQQVASAAADSLRTLRDKVIQRGGREFAKTYDDTVKYYTDNFLRFERGAVGRSLAEKMGKETMSNTQVANAVLSDPASVRESLRAAKEAGGAEGAGLVQELRKAYMNKIGLGRGTEMGSRVKYDKEILRELYGYDSSGVFREGLARRKIESMERLNRSLKQSKVDVSKVAPEDVERLLDTLTPKEASEVVARITKKAKLEAAQDEALANTLWKKIAKGEWEAMDNEVFAEAALSKSPKTLRKLLDDMPEGSREPFKQDFVRAIFGTAQDGAQINSRGAALWNPNSLEKTLAKRKSQIKSVLGEDGYEDLVAANKFMKASEAITGQAADVALRASGGPQGFHFFLVGSVLNAFRDRFMGWAYGSGAMKPLLKVMSKNVSDEQFAKNFQRVFSSMIGTRRGVEALAREGEHDPNFKEAAVNMLQGAGGE